MAHVIVAVSTSPFIPHILIHSTNAIVRSAGKLRAVVDMPLIWVQITEHSKLKERNVSVSTRQKLVIPKLGKFGRVPGKDIFVKSAELRFGNGTQDGRRSCTHLPPQLILICPYPQSVRI